MANKEQLRKVALYCNEYRTTDDESFKSIDTAFGKQIKSCENCVHFTKQGKCDIDLIDKTLSSMGMELDFK